MNKNKNIQTEITNLESYFSIKIYLIPPPKICLHSSHIHPQSKLNSSTPNLSFPSINKVHSDVEEFLLLLIGIFL